MQSFHKLVTLLALMLFASKEAIALPYPQVPNTAVNSIGSAGNQIGVATGNISPSSFNGGNPPFFSSFIPSIPSGTTAASTIGAAGNQIGVASGNISPGSVNARDEAVVEARQFTGGFGFNGGFNNNGGSGNNGGFNNNGGFGSSNNNGASGSNIGGSQSGSTIVGNGVNSNANGGNVVTNGGKLSGIRFGSTIP